MHYHILMIIFIVASYFGAEKILRVIKTDGCIITTWGVCKVACGVYASIHRIYEKCHERGPGDAITESNTEIPSFLQRRPSLLGCEWRWGDFREVVGCGSCFPLVFEWFTLQVTGQQCTPGSFSTLVLIMRFSWLAS